MRYNFARFTDEANAALNAAIEAAEQLGHTYIGSEHLLLGLLSTDCAANQILSDIDVSYEELSEQIAEKIGQGDKTALTTEHFTPRANNIIENAARFARHQSVQKAGSEYILFALISENENYAIKFLMNMGADIEELQQKTVEAINVNIEPQNGASETAPKNKKSKDGTFDKFGTDLTKKASEGKLDPVIARENEIKRVVEILCRRNKNNPCLIGEAGVGKTAIAEGLAQMIADKKAPDFLQNKKIISLDLTGMVAGTKYRGDFEDRIKKIIDAALKDENIILFIDEIHTLIGAGSAEGSTDAANILKPYLARGELQVIGATTIEEYRKYIEKDAALERRFQPVNVGEPSVEDAITILSGLKTRYEQHHSVTISDEAVDSAVRLSSRYIFDRFLPDKAIDILDEAAAKVRLRACEPTPEIIAIENDVERLEKEKSECISSQNFEKAAEI
ncbi:MAG: ATP-dependent Clp protease ATP-binding subunit, partial [Oscillospiraceae bacterium]|nr:ATP-dependent Clp protease ATP-binding subunit [Candidatus Equicaccousia limihippi]